MGSDLQFDTYQEESALTDISEKDDLLIPMLGIAGEAGSLLSQYKKHLRDGSPFSSFEREAKEDLGDILWYVAQLATRLSSSLSEIARHNRSKTKSRWIVDNSQYQLFDEDRDESERLPRSFVVEFRENIDSDSPVIDILLDGQSIGDPLTDNSYDDDGYRFHDVFHLSYAAILGWSPVIRKLLSKKRKTRSDSEKNVDEVEDGGRAAVIEEGIVALVFSYAQSCNFFLESKYIDYEILRTIKSMTSGLEVSKRTFKEWEDAIIQGFNVWHQVRCNHGGFIEVNLHRQSLLYYSD